MSRLNTGVLSAYSSVPRTERAPDQTVEGNESCFRIFADRWKLVVIPLRPLISLTGVSGDAAGGILSAGEGVRMDHGSRQPPPARGDIGAGGVMGAGVIATIFSPAPGWM